LNTRGSNKKTSVKRNYFCHYFFSGDLFSPAPYGLIVVLHQDVLFHSTQVTGAMTFKIQGRANRAQPGPRFEWNALMLLLNKTAQLKVENSGLKNEQFQM
jgi:hypothetical protein